MNIPEREKEVVDWLEVKGQLFWECTDDEIIFVQFSTQS